MLLAVLIVFFIVLHYVEYIDDFMDRSAKMSEIFTIYYPNFIPEIVKLTSPLAVFMASIYLMGRLAQSLQIVALQASGVSLYRLSMPFALYAVLITVFMFWFNGWVVPQTNATVLDFEARYLKDAPLQTDLTNVFRQNRPGSILSIGYFDRDMLVAHRVSLQEFEEGQVMTRRIDAVRMGWDPDSSNWVLHNALIRTFSPEGLESQHRVEMMDTTLNIYPSDLARTDRDVESMSIPDAAGHVASLRRSGVANLGRTLVGYYSKFSYPFANLILVLIAVPIASVRRRGGQAIQLGLGLLVAFFYLAVLKLSEPFGYTGAVEPLIVSWLPHLIFALLALVLLIKSGK